MDPLLPAPQGEAVILDHVEGSRERAKRGGCQPLTWLIWKMTQAACTTLRLHQRLCVPCCLYHDTDWDEMLDAC